MEAAFKGIENLYGPEGLKRIEQAKFLIIGIGGVGSWIAESLVRSGAQNISLVDLDEICLSNLNRQVHSTFANIGAFKIDEMKKRLLSINPDCHIECIYDFLSASTADKILNRSYSYVFDAIDGAKSKCILLSVCKKLELPVITIGAAGARQDPTKIQITDLSKTINDKLLSRVRKKLRREYNFSKFSKKPMKIPAVFSSEIPQGDFYSENNIANCQSGMGSASFVTATFGFYAVGYVLKEVANG